MTTPTYSLPVLPANLQVRVNNTQVMIISFSLANMPLVSNTTSNTTTSNTTSNTSAVKASATYSQSLAL